MWIRIACPNGHALEQREARIAARSGKCPKCLSVVSMWTKVNCPNGHALKVKTKFAGHDGKCPECQATVHIPEMTEEDILELVGRGFRAKAAALPVHQEPKHQAAIRSSGRVSDSSASLDSSILGAGSSLLRRLPRSCPSCKGQVPPNYQICPHCKTYLPFTDVSEAAEVSGHAATIHCPNCGATSFPGSTVCTSCGIPFVS